MTASALPRIDMPIISETRLEVDKNEEMKAAIIERKQQRMEFWMGTMNSFEDKMADRIRASELAAKADGDFVERKEISVTATYREMLLTRAGKLEELEPPHKQSLLEADFVNEFEDAEELEYETTD